MDSYRHFKMLFAIVTWDGSKTVFLADNFKSRLEAVEFMQSEKLNGVVVSYNYDFTGD